MKKYIKPNTEITKVIFEGSLLTGTATPPSVDPNDSTTPEGSDAKGTIFSSSSLWDEEE